MRAIEKPSIRPRMSAETFGLIDTEHLGGLALAQIARAKTIDDLAEQLGLDGELVGIRETQVRENVATTFYEFFRLCCDCWAHFNLSLTKSISRCGVAIALFDFF